MTVDTTATDAFGVFGTTAVLLVAKTDALGPARALADRELAAVDRACSRFRADSELSRLNAAGGAAVTVSALFADLIEAALLAAQLTDGDVDPTCGQALSSLGYDRDFAEVRLGTPALTSPAKPVPGWQLIEFDAGTRRVRLPAGVQLDLGATAKARAADRCAALISTRLGCGVLVSLGGDAAVAGPTPADCWRVHVTDDHAAGPDVPGQTVTIVEGGLATSSTTVRAWTAGGQAVHHIIDPATGRPAQSCWRTVTVAAGTCLDANMASTAAIIRSEAAPGWLEAAGLPARLVGPDGRVVTTAGWPADDPDA
jgi:FAD:protein FMN transferase